MPIPDLVQILEVKRYSKNTIKSYVSIIQLANHHFKGKLDSVSDNDLHHYFYFMIHEKRASYSYQKQIAMALKLYFKEVVNKNIYLEFLLPKRKPKRLPVILSIQEIQKLVKDTTNKKHKCMIAMLYSAGLRIGELMQLKINDIDSDRMVIHVKAAKGNKDRVVPLSQKALLLLREYYKAYTPTSYLFQGQNRGMYSSSSFNKLLKAAAKRMGIKKNFTAHSLRHSYATHLLENGTDIRVIQKLLVHNSIKTTMIYTQVTSPTLLNVKSPFDS